MYSRGAIVTLAMFILCAAAAARAESCPALRDKQPLVSVDLFDGPVEEMADLVPDASTDSKNHAHASWKLGYIYDGGHAVYVKCVYRGAKDALVVKLDRKVENCVFDRTKDKPASLTCE
jgi:hypothetical protein